MTDQQKTDHISDARQMVGMDHAELLGQLRLVRSSGARAGKPWNDDGPAAADAIEALLSDNAALRAERDEAVNAGLKLSAAISWLDYPFIDNNTSDAELLSRVGHMMKDAAPHRTFLQSIARETGK